MKEVEVEVEAKSVDEAVKIALHKLGAKREEVKIKIINEGKMGLFGLMGATPAQIKVTLNDKKDSLNEQKPSVLAGSQKKVKEVLTDILGLMGIKSDIETSVLSGRIVAEIKSSEGNLLIGKRGQTLDALQFITKVIVNKGSNEQFENERVKIILDTEGYRHKREQTLIQLAKELAMKVKSSGVNHEMEPMSPQDRRIIHINIGEDPDLDVNSIGDGIYKKITISRKNQESYRDNKDEI